jgi:hypothetical protein
MARDGRLYVQFSPELREQLGDQLSLGDILSQAGIDAGVEWHALPPSNPDERTKALVETVQLVSLGAVSVAAAIKLIESAITHYLNNKAVRDSHFSRWVNRPVVDKKGKPLLNKDGTPVLTRERVGGFDEFPSVPGEGLSLKVSTKSLEFSVGNQASDNKSAGKVTKK